jgi:rod shape-determining protein MreD
LFRPDFVAMTIAYWGISYPHKMGMSVAFGLGLMMDVGNAGILGQHALAYCVDDLSHLDFWPPDCGYYGLMKQAPQIALVLLMMQLRHCFNRTIEWLPFIAWIGQYFFSHR